MQRSVVNRRLFLCGLGSVAVGARSGGLAQARGRVVRYPWAPWKKKPSITVMSAANDIRLPAVNLAVEFWNDALANLGSAFRLGSITYIPEPIAYGDIFRSQYAWNSFDPRYSDWYVDVAGFRARLGKVSGDVIVFLADGDGSFVTPQVVPGKLAAVIQSQESLVPYKIAVHHVVAHEFGHVIGLAHNDAPMALMCGNTIRHNWCNGAAAARTVGFAPLTSDDKRQLLEMYPPHWPEEGPGEPWKGDPPVLPNVRFGARVRATS